MEVLLKPEKRHVALPTGSKADLQLLHCHVSRFSMSSAVGQRSTLASTLLGPSPQFYIKQHDFSQSYNLEVGYIH